jgi:hypothetical protein
MKQQALKALPVAYLIYWSTLNTEVTFSSETSVGFRRIKRSYIPEDRTLHNHLCENLRPY